MRISKKLFSSKLVKEDHNITIDLSPEGLSGLLALTILMGLLAVLVWANVHSKDLDKAQTQRFSSICDNIAGKQVHWVTDTTAGKSCVVGPDYHKVDL